MKKVITKKTYIALRSLMYATNIVVAKDDIRRIAFLGGIRTPKVVNGTFATEDEALQKAMEADPAYGVKYKLKIKTTRTIEVPDENPKTSTDTGNTDTNTDTGTDDTNLEDKSFPTAAAAKDWMLETYTELSANQIRNKDLMVEVAKGKGINLVFDK